MTSKGILTTALSVLGATALLAQTEAPRLPAPPANPPAPSLQSAADPGYAALTAMCKTPPPGRGGRAGGPARGGAGGRGPQAPGPREYTVTEIPGVIAAGQKWNVRLAAGRQQRRRHRRSQRRQPAAGAERQQRRAEARQERQDVGCLLGHAHRRRAVDEPEGQPVHRRARPARAHRAARAAAEDARRHRSRASPSTASAASSTTSTADSKGGVYFTMGGLFHADPKGTITRYGENLTTNGVILSADEKTLYVTNGPALAAFDVQKDGSLTNQREFAKLTAGGGDGSTIDSQGRLYVTTNGGVEVIGADGKNLGVIPTPRGVITCAFGGKDKKTLFILAQGRQGRQRRGSGQRRAGLDDPDDRAGLQRPREIVHHGRAGRGARAVARLVVHPPGRSCRPRLAAPIAPRLDSTLSLTEARHAEGSRGHDPVRDDVHADDIGGPCGCGCG